MNKMLLLAALSGAIFVVSGSAWAEDGGMNAPVEKGQMEREGHKKGKMFERVDTDGDGIISEAEFMEAHKHRFKEIDSNSDGQISKDEAKAHRESMHEKMKEHREGRKERREKHDDSSSGASE